MKKFLIKISFLVLPIIVLAYPLDIFLSSYIKKSSNANREFSVWNDLYSNKINDDIIVVGNSRAWTQISPKILEERLGKSTYNIGMDGQSFDMQLLRFNELLKHRQSPPPYVISIVDEYFLREDDGVYNKEQFLPYMLFNSSLYSGLKNKSNFSFWEFYLPLIRYYGGFHGIGYGLLNMTKLEHPRKERFKGYLPNTKKWQITKPQPSYFVIDQVNYAAYNQFLDLCKKNKSELIMVFPPAHTSIDTIVLNRQHILDTLSDISEKHHVLFIDFRNSYLNQDSILFTNRTHLNKKGAELFTNMLVDSIEQKHPFK